MVDQNEQNNSMAPEQKIDSREGSGSNPEAQCRAQETGRAEPTDAGDGAVPDGVSKTAPDSGGSVQSLREEKEREGDEGGEGEGAEDCLEDGKPGEDRLNSRHSRNSAYEISRILAAVDGDRKKAADILGIFPSSLDNRIQMNKSLAALWGRGHVDAKGPSTPEQADTLFREIPDRAPTGIELATMVGKLDRLSHEKGLRKLGISEPLLERIRNLDGLAPTSGHFIAIALENTHRSYYVQSMQLMELAETLHRRLVAPKGSAGAVEDEVDRACFNRNYTDMVREAGRAYELMLTGAQAMVEMMLKMRDHDGGRRAPKSAGWGRTDSPPSEDAET